MDVIRQHSCYLFICFCFYLAVGNATVIIEGTYEPVRILAGSKLELTCVYSGTTSGGNLSFYKEDNNVETLIDSDTNRGVDIKKSPSKIILTKTTVDATDGGTYRCKYSQTNEAYETKVQVIQVVGGDIDLPDPIPSSATLTCDPTLNPTTTNDAYETRWSRNDTILDDTAKYEKNTTHLTVKNLVRKDDIGTYHCALVFTADQNTVSVPLNLYSAPYIDKKHAVKSKNFKKDEKLEQDCPVIGFPKPTVEWFKDGVAIDMDDKNDRYSFSDVDGVKNARMVIYNLEFEDKGVYKCVGKSVRFNSTEIDILIRVKDKLEALWPFLGIVAEVIVLIIIILIAEKRKRSLEAKEDAIDSPDAAFEPIANAYNERDDVRQRNPKS